MKDAIGLLARGVTGVVWVVAGWLKFADPAATVRDVRAFRILPEAVVPTFGHLLPIVELVLGCCLLLGLLTRFAAIASTLLLTAFVIGIAAAWARGLEIRCGCFGQGGLDADPVPGYIRDIARDVGLVLLSVWLVWRPVTPLSLDRFLFRPTERLDDVEERSAVQD